MLGLCTTPSNDDSKTSADSGDAVVVVKTSTIMVNTTSPMSSTILVNTTSPMTRAREKAIKDDNSAKKKSDEVLNICEE